jgi:hypothetical protein
VKYDAEMLRNRHDLTTVVLAATLLTFTACGGDDSTTKATDPVGAETTAAAPDTVATETTPVAETVATETTEAVEFVAFTPDQLVAALPTPADLGAEWTDLGNAPTVDPEGKEGVGFGTCGGPNGAARALANSATAIVLGPNLQGPGQRRGSTSLYAFPDATTAQAFLDLSAETAQCPDGVTWEWVQKANPTADDEFNGFGPGFEDITENQIWAFTETASAQYGDTEDVMQVSIDRSRELTAAGITFRQTDTTLARYDRYDNLVIVTIVGGTWGQEGYINADALVNFQPSSTDLDEYTAVVAPVVLQRLGWE